MVMTCGAAAGSRSSFGFRCGTEPIDEGLCEFIASDIMRGTLDVTLVMFEMIEERITKMMDEPLQAYRVEMSTRQYKAHTLTFKDFKGCGLQEFFGVKDTNVARRWIVDMEFSKMKSFYPEGRR